MWTLITLLALVAGAAGLVSIVVPLRFIGIKSRWRGLAVAALALFAFVAAGSQIAPPVRVVPASAVEQATHSPNRAPAPAARSQPADQARFIEIVEAAREKYRAGSTEFLKGATRPERASKLCTGRKGDVSGWIGEIVELTTNSDGKGVIAVQISPNITLRTWNNSFSDVGDHTLIEPGTKLFAQLGELKVGDMVKFSGKLLQSDTDCFRESSMTLAGSMEDPEFILRFRNIESAQ